MDDKAASNPNIEWKKSGFEDEERVTLKVNVKKAAEHDAQKSHTPKNKVNNADLPVGLKKIRKKIKDVFDEEDEDEDENNFQISLAQLDASNSLLNALSDNERTMLKQQENIDTTKQLQNAGKMEAITTADKFAKEAGLEGLKKENVGVKMQDVIISGHDALQNSVKDDVAKKMGMKWGKISDRELIDLLRGIKRVQNIGGADAVKGMKVKDVVEFGGKKVDEKKVEKKIEEVILEKSGRDKKQHKKMVEQKKFDRTKNVKNDKKLLKER